MFVDHTKNIIELHDISFSYSEGEEVLKEVNLNVHKGDYLGIIGPNGGGKTTLLKIMLGLLKPDKGSVRLFGQNIADFKDWYKIGYVPQKAVSFETSFPVTVEEVVTMGRYGRKKIYQMLNTIDKKVIQKSLEQVEMWKYKDTILGDLSGGQQQRVFIARALATQPEVIFLDEPTAGVDAETQRHFYDLLKNLNRQLNLTLILVSHDNNIISRETTEAACVNKTLVYATKPEDFKFSNHKH